MSSLNAATFALQTVKPACQPDGRRQLNLDFAGRAAARPGFLADLAGLRSVRVQRVEQRGLSRQGCRKKALW